MKKGCYLAIAAVVLLLAFASSTWAQRPHIGFVYPAGGQMGTTFPIRIGGQGLDGVHEVHVSGKGVTVTITEYHWQMSPQDATLLSQQLNELRRIKKPTPAESNLIERIEYRLRNRVQQPASRSIANLVYANVTIARDAMPGERELRVITTRGPSNPLVFYVGQAPEYTRKPMRTCPQQILGKEYLALRNRPAEEAEVAIKIPCILNGQIAPREVNSYRFTARKGQRLVITTLARQLIPYIADGVPGWFQPVLALYDSTGKEVAYCDDYRFKPDPVIHYEVPRDGEYVLAIYDSIFRGREDFVYRIAITSELPFLSSIFPLGGRVGEPVSVQMRGWNLDGAVFVPPPKTAGPGIHQVYANRHGFLSNAMPFALDTLPEEFEKETGDSSLAQKVTTPVIINGRIDKPGDIDVFQFYGRGGETIVAEVLARRLDSPLDSVLKLTDSKGNLIAFNDDWEDLASGLNTHHADSYFMVKLPADGIYFLYITDAARLGGEEYAYRLRISPPRPDFALRVVPSSAGLRSKESTSVSVYGLRKDGFTGPITISLKDPPPSISFQPVVLGTQAVTRLTFRAGNITEKQTLNLKFEGRAKIGTTEVVREVVPAEDKMQAFLWRHLVPAQEFAVTLFPRDFQLPPKRVPPTLTPEKKAELLKVSTSAKGSSGDKGKFTKGQVAGRLRQLRRLYEDGYFTDSFYLARVAECEAAQ